MRVVAAVILAALVALFLIARLRYSGTAPMKLPPGNCDASLWAHVYDKERLRVIERCAAAEGRVVSTHRAADGDLHIALDPQDKHVLNLVNATHGRGELVVEIICEHLPAKAVEQAACGSYRWTASIPKAGDRIRITGAYVADRDNGWNEMHPVTRIDVLP